MTADRLASPRLTHLAPEPAEDEMVELLDDDDIGLPAALVAIVFILAVAGAMFYALWLAAVQCIKIGGCG